MKLTLPLPPNMANSRRHWRVTLKEKKAYWHLCDLFRMNGTIPKPPAEPPEKVRAHVTLYLWAPMDDFNAGNRLKWVEDWLTANGYITDDSRKHLEYAGFPVQVIDRKNPRIELELQPTSGPDLAAPNTKE